MGLLRRHEIFLVNVFFLASRNDVTYFDFAFKGNVHCYCMTRKERHCEEVSGIFAETPRQSPVALEIFFVIVP